MQRGKKSDLTYAPAAIVEFGMSRITSILRDAVSVRALRQPR
jgi:hypothetical protein